tara:strand:+ start:262 stop:438 length:177 start_codon:yes stop_codon:yes gene_type:complete
MTICAILTLTQIAIIIMLGAFLGALLVWFWYYRDMKKNLDYIHELEQTLNDNKIWIKN